LPPLLPDISQYGIHQHLENPDCVGQGCFMEKYDFRTRRLFVSDTLEKGTAIQPDRAAANYLLNVLRLKNNAPILLFNGRDGEWQAHLEATGRKQCRLVAEVQTRPQPAPYSLTYCFAPLKQSRLDYMVQKAVEMGAGVLQPVLTHHTQVTKLNLERVKANATEAAEQCGILNIPQCREPMKLEVFLAGWNKDQRLIYADEAGSNDPVSALKALAPGAHGILIGPEGGFSEAEREMLRAMPFVLPISLGPRILRADTAAVAALAIYQAIGGDW
jgi:16S rRNA (uracil1498-N3)-methyltransferase